MKNNFFSRGCLFLLISICGLICFKQNIYALQVDEECTGLLPPTKEEEEFLNNIPEIEWVNLNEDALSYIKTNYKNISSEKLNRIETAEIGEEFISEQDAVSRSSNAEARELQKEIVSQVEYCDVSVNNTFPPIENQGSTGSCTAWAMGYYQLTNNIAKIRNLDAKHTGRRYHIAPGWLYNLCKTEKNNDAESDGTHESPILSVLMKQGAPYWSDTYGQPTKENYKSWNPDVSDWESALDNRIEKYEYISLYNGSEFDLSKLKTTLLDGYVVSFSSYFSQNQYTRQIDWVMDASETIIKAMKKFPEDSVKKHVGHEMTVVGFDDNKIIDYGVNPKTNLHQYGHGALKIANSWGEDRGDKGYYWIAYDALKNTSEFEGDHTQYREPAISRAQVVYMTPRKSYTPLLLAKVTLETNSRRQLGLAFDIKPNADTKYMRYIYRYENNSTEGNEFGTPFWFKNNDDDEYVAVQNLDFLGRTLGTSTRGSATFLFDLTDTVLQKYNQYTNNKGNDTMSFYVYIQDAEKDGYSSALTKVEIIDRINNKSQTKSMNLVVDGSVKSEKLDFTIKPRIVGEKKKFKLNFNYPIQESTIKKGLTIGKKVKNISGYTLSSVGITYDILDDRKTISVDPPETKVANTIEIKYENGSYYSMNLKGLKSDGGNSLTGQDIFDFYVPGY